MQFKDYYQTLGVSRGADAEEVKRAYRKLARKYHPDVSKEKNAEAKFKDVQEAYEVLRDADKRAAYDQLGRDYRGGQQFRPPPDWEQRFGQTGGHRFSDLNGFSDFFSSLFGAAGGGGASGYAQPEPEGGQLEVSVEEAYAGTRRRVTIHENGRARLVDVQIPAGVTDGQALRVGGVGGRGHQLIDAIGKVGGTVELTIPAGAQAGQKLRLRGRGFPGAPAGDQFVILKLVTPSAETLQAKEAYERMRREFNFDPRAGWP